jgi:protein ImuB
MTRYASIWFPFLLSEHAIRKQPELCEVPFVLASRKKGRMVIDASSKLATQKGIFPGMVLADCKALFPELQMLASEPGKSEKLVLALAEWCVRYTPFVATDFPDGLLLDTSGCTHLWGGERAYIETIKEKLASFGYTVSITIADTIGTAWGVARYNSQNIVPEKKQQEALKNLTASALRLNPIILSKLKKLGLQRIDSFIGMPRESLRRRFGPELPLRIGQALGQEIELIVPIKPVEPYMERLHCLEPISTATGITIALEQLLQTLCTRLESEGLGLRKALFSAYRIDGDIQQLEIGTGHPSRNTPHLFKLFEHKIATLEPSLGFELFILEAPTTEPVSEEQAMIWNALTHNDKKIAELIDRITARKNTNAIGRYLATEHYWPERSVKEAAPLWEKASIEFRNDLPRPIHLLPKPETINVTAVLPDNPPLFFRYKGKLHNVSKSDGPERIEQEWWISDGLYRDYYCVEDTEGARYWLFRSGPYEKEQPQWFLHGFFA